MGGQLLPSHGRINQVSSTRGELQYEEFVYDEAGTPLNGSFASHLMPTFMEMPPVRIEHLWADSIGRRNTYE